MAQDVLVGIDVGGTFTDAVAVRAGNVAATAKVATEPENLARSLLGALDNVLIHIAADEVARVSLSTTLITNLLAQERVPEIGILLIPGPGRDPATYPLPGPHWVVGGMVDFRGRERVPLNQAEVTATLEEIQATGLRRLAIVGKFSPRNPSQEEQALAWARQVDAGWHLRAGHTASGRLNFPRRAAATATMLAIEEPYRAFFTQLQEALTDRGLTCPMVILKADGGAPSEWRLSKVAARCRWRQPSASRSRASSPGQRRARWVSWRSDLRAVRPSQWMWAVRRPIWP